MRRILKALKNVPNSNTITEGLWHYFSGYLEVDAKYISINGKKYAFIWMVDYYSHDILYYLLASSENYEAYRSCFSHLRRMGIYPRVVTCDEHQSILRAIRSEFSASNIQLCHVHILRNIKKLLDTNSTTDMDFYSNVCRLLDSRNNEQFFKRGVSLQQKYWRNPLYATILKDLDLKTDYITVFMKYRKAPKTTNLIECYNSHLAQRLRAIKGFESYESADLWLNAYVLRKRTKPLTDCSGRFRRLNGTPPLFNTVGDSGPVEKIAKYFAVDFRV